MLNGERIGLPHSLLLSVLQEEERERRMDYIPEESAINVENIEVCDEASPVVLSCSLWDINLQCLSHYNMKHAPAAKAISEGRAPAMCAFSA